MKLNKIKQSSSNKSIIQFFSHLSSNSNFRNQCQITNYYGRSVMKFCFSLVNRAAIIILKLKFICLYISSFHKLTLAQLFQMTYIAGFFLLFSQLLHLLRFNIFYF
ncbi:unnamed protein product [Paramecium sonneborni]|uniref:Transmembrane protein n=1 Tax=Paramecium sonneborni TaxID=65129 RepID=A0A8S1QWS6_9CILI|nr:unnamed protein product [Paramecium sonneborni]